jgi:hypothetical protein
VTVSFTSPSRYDTRLDVFTILGQRVHRSHHAPSVGPTTVRLDATSWPSGPYVVRRTAGGVGVSQLLVRR